VKTLIPSRPLEIKDQPPHPLPFFGLYNERTKEAQREDGKGITGGLVIFLSLSCVTSWAPIKESNRWAQDHKKERKRTIKCLTGNEQRLYLSAPTKKRKNKPRDNNRRVWFISFTFYYWNVGEENKKRLTLNKVDSRNEIRLTKETRIKLYCQPPVSSLTTFPLLGFFHLVTARH